MQQKEEEIKQNLKNSLKKELRKELEDFYKQQMRELVNENEKKTKEVYIIIRDIWLVGMRLRVIIMSLLYADLLMHA